MIIQQVDGKIWMPVGQNLKVGLIGFLLINMLNSIIYYNTKRSCLTNTLIQVTCCMCKNSLISCYTLVQLNYTLEMNFCQVGEAELPSSSGCKRHGKGDRVEIWLKSNVAFLQCLL